MSEKTNFEAEVQRYTDQVIKTFEALKAASNNPDQNTVLWKIAENIVMTAAYRLSPSVNCCTASAALTSSTEPSLPS